jgi:hypothetical protein
MVLLIRSVLHIHGTYQDYQNGENYKWGEN